MDGERPFNLSAYVLFRNDQLVPRLKLHTRSGQRGCPVVVLLNLKSKASQLSTIASRHFSPGKEDNRDNTKRHPSQQRQSKPTRPATKRSGETESKQLV